MHIRKLEVANIRIKHAQAKENAKNKFEEFRALYHSMPNTQDLNLQYFYQKICSITETVQTLLISPECNTTDYEKLTTSLTHVNALMTATKAVLSKNSSEEKGNQNKKQLQENLKTHLDNLRVNANETIGRPESKWKAFGGALKCLVGAAAVVAGILFPPLAIPFFVVGGALFLWGCKDVGQSAYNSSPSGLSKSLHDLCDSAEKLKL